MSALLQPRWCSDGLIQRIDWVDWPGVGEQLDAYGCARIPALLDPDECDAMATLYDLPDGFRSTVTMARHGFGRGEYRYFSYPLPATVAALRGAVYPHLVAIANRWNQAMAIDVRYPDEHERFIARCHEAGQTRPTPLLLRYDKGDYNCLHQDVYGEHVFPLQLVVLLSRPQHDFEGGELVLTEQRPRMQSRVEVLPLQQGDAAVFAVRERPVKGSRGTYRVQMRHGVSRVHAGRRHTLGVIFHDAR
jgi:hypothetical protein